MVAGEAGYPGGVDRGGRLSGIAGAEPRMSEENAWADSLFAGTVTPPRREPLPELVVRGVRLRTTPVFETYWRFAAERQEMFYRRLRGEWPLTQDAILRHHRFTNAYRASDRVSQYLIGRVIPQSRGRADNVLFRTLLFKLFNRIETFEALEQAVGAIALDTFDFDAYDEALTAIGRDGQLYSGAYIMPSPPFGHSRKHSNHLRLLEQLRRERFADRLVEAGSLSEAYKLLLAVPSLGPFLAFQFAIDLNYGPVLNFEEESFVVAGPGALDGIRKCFGDIGALSPADIIHAMTEQAGHWFETFEIDFPGLWGRALQPIDIQNLFCETDKYARAAHPEIAGISGRTRIKQTYRPNAKPLRFAYPAKWGLSGETRGVPAPRAL